MLSEFREFLTKSNALALAIGVIIGTALATQLGLSVLPQNRHFVASPSTFSLQ